MIAEIGNFALQLNLVFLLVATFLPLIKKEKNYAYMEAAIIVSCILFSISFLALIYSHASSDFSVVNVAMNSHTSKPMLYKITGAWGNHEGSMLLFLWLMSLFTFLFTVFGKFSGKGIVLHSQSALLLMIEGFLLFESNPLLRVFPVPENGQGLNPLLQDVGLAIHPPMLYIGYVGISLAFSFGIAALIRGQINKEWAKALKDWLTLSWAFLTIGIGLGSWWAYRELGWGGYWFWDPVENSSLLPWLAATALLHSVIVVEKREALKIWTILLSIIAFGYALLGLFLVRSGILTSVHSFASDPGRGVFILAIMFIFIGGGLTLFAFRAARFSSFHKFNFISREFCIQINNLMIFIASLIIMLGTTYPVFQEVFNGKVVAVGAAYFNQVLLPLVIAILVFSVVSPYISWQQDKFSRLRKRLILPAILGFISVIVILFLYGLEYLKYAAVIGCAMSVLAGMSSFFLNSREKKKITAVVLSHIGIGILAIGVSVSSGWKNETQKIMAIKEEINFAGFEIVFDSLEVLAGDNYLARIGKFIVTRKNKEVAILAPETRFYPVEKSQTTESAIYNALLSDLYIVIGDPDVVNGEVRGYAVRIYYEPLISLVWIGCLLIALGGFAGILLRKK